METETEPKKCKKLTYLNSKQEFSNKPTILLGIILGEDDHFVKFKTAHKEYSIGKSCIISIEDTNETFRGGF